MAKEPNETKRKHVATYARDKKKGGYLIRVIGPNAPEFSGREVPVTMKDRSEHKEMLDRLIWSGIDNGTEDNPGSGQPAALYTFKSKPREKVETEF